MKKNVRLKAVETAATNKEFYNLFRPIAPSVDVIGKVAQVISGLTEALTVWHICQSELSGAHKAIAILVSLVAMLLVVSILELGGRKFLQVLTRALVWKRLKNAWSRILFGIVAFITMGIMFISFRLSTNGIRHAFTNKLSIPVEVDIGDLQKAHDRNLALIISQFDDERTTLKDNHLQMLEADKGEFDSKVAAVLLKVDHYESRLKNGAKWARGHAEKFRKQIAQLETEKASSVSKANHRLGKKLESWQRRKSQAMEKEAVHLQAQIDERKALFTERKNAKLKKASFWGNLFSFLVGFSVILAFICIVTVELFRRGSGIEVSYEEQEQKRSLILMLWEGINARWDRFFRKRIEGFANISATPKRSIGFNSSLYPSNDSKGDLPYMENELQ